MAADVTVLTVYRQDEMGGNEPAVKVLVQGAAGTTVEWSDISINSLGTPGEVIVAKGVYNDNQSLDLLLAAIYPGNGDPAVVPHMVIGYRHFIGENEVNLYDDLIGSVGRQQVLAWLTTWKPEAVAGATGQIAATMTRDEAIEIVRQVIQPV